MLLAIDVGNTNTVFGLDGGDGSWAARGRLSTIRLGVAGDWAPAITAFFQRDGIEFSSISAVCLCSVVPAATAALSEFARNWLDVDPMIVGAGMRFNVSLEMENPSEVGADRIANAVSAWNECMSACIVVDLGTATKVEAISDAGAFLGGSIATGIGVSLDALTARAARLFPIELSAPSSAIGRNTTHAMQSGLVRGHFHLVSGLVADIRTEFARQVPVLVTGGFAVPDDSPFRELGRVVPDLTIDGIRIIHALNAS